MPADRVGYHLRLGSIALVALSLLTCGGDKIDDLDGVRVNGAADGDPTSRVDSRSASSRLAASIEPATAAVGDAAAP